VSLVKVPQGFEKDNPAAEFLKLKSFLAMKKLKDTDITVSSLKKQVLDAFDALQPLVEFINKALEE
jgi:uncharacterized protein (DUF2461 family)